MSALNETAASDEQIIKEDTEKLIQQAISQLSPQRQEVFRLSREEFLSYDEIAEKIQLSKFTVRNHLSAALQFLRGHISNGSELAIIITLVSKQY